ncbi:DedA family protein [Herbidospora mongoliensis]|uniref:DedA family protein n=1 Tax=Herbidospora mongoliensis TaxID=688067 RepID=UPI00082FAD2F|nr:DedA family protein [Herbidospora mongoliensis]
MEKLDGIAGWVVGLMETLGAPGAGLATAIENLAPPIPSELILPLAGFTASQGEMSLVAAIVWTTTGSVAGALVLYGLGALLGRDRTVALLGRIPMVTVGDIEKTEAWFARHGRKTVFFGRMIPVFRSLISIPAGVERMPLPTFTLLTALGSAIWNSIFVLAGYLLGENWEIVQRYSGWFTNGVVVLCAVAVVTFVIVRMRAKVR